MRDLKMHKPAFTSFRTSVTVRFGPSSSCAVKQNFMQLF